MINYIIAIMYIVFMISLFCAAVYLFILIVKALKKYINSKDVREEKKVNAKSLGESLKENRLRCKMTQEFVAETLEVYKVYQKMLSLFLNGRMEQVIPIQLILLPYQDYIRSHPKTCLNVFKKRACLMNRQARQKGKYIMKKTYNKGEIL